MHGHKTRIKEKQHHYTFKSIGVGLYLSKYESLNKADQNIKIYYFTYFNKHSATTVFANNKKSALLCQGACLNDLSKYHQPFTTNVLINTALQLFF